MNRRTFTRTAFGGGAGLMATTVGCSTRVPPYTPPPPGPLANPVGILPQESGIDHVIVVTMENRSFDHLLGWLPRAAGIPPGLSYPDISGTMHPVYPLSGDYTGCGHSTPDNSYGTPNRIAYDGGKMDGFLRVPGNDIYSIGYYGADDLPFLTAFAQSFTTCDRWFASVAAETFPNRLFLWAAQTDRLSNTFSFSKLPTIFDRLAHAGISHRYYFGNIPFLALWGLKYLARSSDFDDFISAAHSGNLPAVSFVDPKFTEFNDVLGNDGHPYSDIRNADAFMSRVFNAVASGPKWASTVLIVTFDEWGGFFDHIAPPRVIAPNTIDPDLVNGGALLGCRVPTVIASPFTRGANRIDSTQYDHTAILKLIEWRWGLSPLTLRDASPSIGNPVAGFNFTSPDTSVPQLPTPAIVAAHPCAPSGISPETAQAGKAGQNKTEFAGLHGTKWVHDWLNHPKFKTKARQ